MIFHIYNVSHKIREKIEAEKFDYTHVKRLNLRKREEEVQMFLNHLHIYR